MINVLNRPWHRVAIVGCLLAVVTSPASAMMFETVGPLKGDRLHAQPGWPGGLIDVMGHPSRVYSYDVNGSEKVFFKSDLKQVAELIQTFSKMRCRDQIVQLKTKADKAKSIKGTEYAHNVTLDVTGGIALGMHRLKGKAPATHEPVLTIIVDEDIRALLEEIKWPNNLIVKNEVPDFEIKSPREQPVRKNWHTAVNFEDGKPAVDFESDIQTTVTLWEKGHPVGFDLGKVTHKGTFTAPFSEEEIARLEKNELWMTMTVGNWAKKAKPNDARLDIENFDLDASLAQTAVAFKPQLYHGQLLFEDGTPAVLDPEPWPGAEIHVTFPYSGMVRPDKEGKFKLSFTKDQLEDLKEKRDRKNIYVPSYKQKGRSTALHVFPVRLLSADAKTPGVLKIPKPKGLDLDF